MSSSFYDDIYRLAFDSMLLNSVFELGDPNATIMPNIADTTHDLHNLVSTFKTRLYLIQKSPKDLDKHISQLNHLVNYLDSLVNKLIAESEPILDTATHAADLVNLNAVVTRVITAYEPIAQCKRIVLTFGADPDLPLILADEPDMERLVSNMLSNAMNYTPVGGVVTLETSRESDTVSLVVRDTGIGISTQALPHIFERYYRTEEAQNIASGSGLGLSICRRIVELYGGHIEVDSTVDVGTAFKVLLPAVI